jgi:polar amino acid transport system substrate-binding protein
LREQISRTRIKSLAAVILLGVVPPVLAGRSRLVLVTAEDVADSFHGAWLKMIYTDACARIGWEMTLQSYPARRATAMSDSGMADGEINRVSSYGELHPDMIRIDPPHFSMSFCAYGYPSQRVGEGWSGLSAFGNPRIEYRNGVVRCREMLSASLPAWQVSVVNNATLGIRKLVQRRTDVYVDIDSVVERTLLQPEFASASIRTLSVIETAQMHCYIHRSKRELATPLSAALAAMHKDGSVKRFREVAIAASRRQYLIFEPPR